MLGSVAACSMCAHALARPACCHFQPPAPAALPGAGAAILRMLQTFLKSPIPLGYAQRIAAGDYSAETGFAVDLALKDVG